MINAKYLTDNNQILLLLQYNNKVQLMRLGFQKDKQIEKNVLTNTAHS